MPFSSLFIENVFLILGAIVRLVSTVFAAKSTWTIVWPTNAKITPLAWTRLATMSVIASPVFREEAFFKFYEKT